MWLRNLQNFSVFFFFNAKLGQFVKLDVLCSFLLCMDLVFIIP